MAAGPARALPRDEPRILASWTPNGRLRHLITLDGVPRSLVVEELLERAQGYVHAAGACRRRGDDLAGWTVANLFAEPSTRTRASFELAAARLGADTINLDVTLSSRAKGETHPRHDLYAAGDAGRTCS